MTEAAKFHLKLTQDMLQGATIALIPGDPARVAQIAKHLQNSKHLVSNREFVSYLGYIDDLPIVITSTGIGGPSTSIAVEELAELGVKTFLRIGTTGAIQNNIKVGDIIITTAAVRLDGASLHFAPLNYPAVADFHCVNALYQSAQQYLELADAKSFLGITASSDTFYPGQERYDTYSKYVLPAFQGSFDMYKKLNILNYEMESATLYTMCSALGLRAGMLAGVLINRNYAEIPDDNVVQNIEESVIKIAINAAKKLAE